MLGEPTFYRLATVFDNRLPGPLSTDPMYANILYLVL